MEAARARLGPVSILVNNAGDGDSADGRAWEIDPADWRAKLAVNVDAPFYLTRLVLPAMLAAGQGRIINIASTAGLVGVKPRGFNPAASNSFRAVVIRRSASSYSRSKNSPSPFV